MRTHEILDLAGRHGLDLREVGAVNEMGIDFEVAFASDVHGRRWVLRIPRRADMAPQIRQEKAILDLVRAHLPIGVPDWEIATPRLVAYPLLEDRPVLTADPETGEVTWNLDRDDPRFVESLARTLVRLHAIPPREAEAIGVKSSSPDEVRQEMRDAIDEVARELGIEPALEARWRRWVDDDGCWPGFSRFIHGDLYAGHVLADEHGEITGIIDWSEGQVGDPATDFAGHVAVFGEEGLRALIGHYERLGGTVWERMFEHTVERAAAAPLIYARFALRTGAEEHIAGARAMLGTA